MGYCRRTCVQYLAINKVMVLIHAFTGKMQNQSTLTESLLTALVCQCCCIIAPLFIKASRKNGSLLSTVYKKNDSIKKLLDDPTLNIPSRHLIAATLPSGYLAEKHIALEAVKFYYN